MPGRKSPGVPGPVLCLLRRSASTKLDTKAKQDVKEGGGPRGRRCTSAPSASWAARNKQGNEKANFTLSVKRARGGGPQPSSMRCVAAKNITVVGKGARTYGDWLKLFEDNQQDRSVKINADEVRRAGRRAAISVL